MDLLDRKAERKEVFGDIRKSVQANSLEMKKMGWVSEGSRTPNLWIHNPVL
jgi:hypothetical protein